MTAIDLFCGLVTSSPVLAVSESPCLELYGKLDIEHRTCGAEYFPSHAKSHCVGTRGGAQLPAPEPRCTTRNWSEGRGTSCEAYSSPHLYTGAASYRPFAVGASVYERLLAVFSRLCLRIPLNNIGDSNPAIGFESDSRIYRSASRSQGYLALPFCGLRKHEVSSERSSIWRRVASLKMLRNIDSRINQTSLILTR